MQPPHAPKVRSRSRDGLIELDWREAPNAAEVWPDKLQLRVRGEVRWPAGTSFYAYLLEIVRDRALTKAPTVGRSYRSPIDWGTLAGDVKITMRSEGRADEDVAGGATIDLTLFLNPTRTRAHIVRRAIKAVNSLTPREFFHLLPSAAEAFNESDFGTSTYRALDGNDNFLATVAELGGSMVAARREARDAFIATYEANLRAFVGELFAAAANPPATGDTLGTNRPNLTSVIDWSDASYRYAELYVERRSAVATSIPKRLSDRGLTLARSIASQRFAAKTPSFSFEIEEGHPHLVLPLTGSRNIALSLYAKTDNRVRIEIRYLRDFSRLVRSCSRGDDRLQSMLHALAGDAIKRLCWKELGAAAQTPPDVDVADVITLINLLHAACGNKPSLSMKLTHDVLLTGGIIADEARHPGISEIIASLVRQRVLEHWRTRHKETKAGRRYGLVAHYAQVRHKMLSGFVPVERPAPVPKESVESESHYELAARLAGSRAMVEGPPS